MSYPHVLVELCDKFLLTECGRMAVNPGSRLLRSDLFPHLLVELKGLRLL